MLKDEDGEGGGENNFIWTLGADGKQLKREKPKSYLSEKRKRAC